MMALPNKLISFEEKKSLIDDIILQGIPEREVNEIRKKLSATVWRLFRRYHYGIETQPSDERSHKFTYF